MSTALSSPDWLVRETGFDFEQANFYETIFTVGNGYQGTRGSLEEGHKGDLSATYLAGVYDAHDSSVIDLVNVATWLPVNIRVDGQALDVQNCEILDHERTLDLKTGLLHRRTQFKDGNGNITTLKSVRLASFANQHLAGIGFEITADNHNGLIEIDSMIDAERYNLDRLPAYKVKPTFHYEVKWQKWAKSRHMEVTDSMASSSTAYIETRTLDTDITIGMVASLKSLDMPLTAQGQKGFEQVGHRVSFQAEQGKSYGFEKLIAIYTSRDVARDEVRTHCERDLSAATDAGLNACIDASIDNWAGKWAATDCTIEGDEEATRAVRFNIYHMLITANENDPKVNIGAKSMSGEGYKGHVFWDTEIFLLPFYIFTQPETAKALLLYRYHTLTGAMENAHSNGFKGAQYPWESADTGHETTPKWTADGQNRIWTGEEEIHITSCVAYGVLNYVNVTGDKDFLRDYGAEILYQTSRFWVSRLEYNESEDRYELTRVIGPDEFHEHIDNNTFTNFMVQWHLRQTVALFDELAGASDDYEAMVARVGVSADEVQSWADIADKIYIPFDESRNLIEQFSGYFDLEDLPITEWDENDMPLYPEGHDHFTLNATMILKQPDVIMLTYLLPDEFSAEMKAVNYEFYEKRTLHKSSLSPAIHCIMGIEVGDYSSAEKYFARSAFVDLINNQGNTQDGIHIASAGGTWQSMVCGFGGLRVKNEQLTFKPWLPPGWDDIQFKFYWRGDQIAVTLKRDSMSFTLADTADENVQILVQDRECELTPGEIVNVALGA